VSVSSENMYTALQVADWFRNAVDRGAGDSITHLKLQKLVYYAQAWSLALLGRPLFAEDVQAWAHGPVVPSVWRHFKDHRWDALPPGPPAAEFDEEAETLLHEVMNSYGERSGTALEELTHSEEPWIRARNGLPIEARSTAVIPQEHMRRFYGDLYEKIEQDRGAEDRR
jgi:uncharacterized phage-associated protein